MTAVIQSYQLTYNALFLRHCNKERTHVLIPLNVHPEQAMFVVADPTISNFASSLPIHSSDSSLALFPTVSPILAAPGMPSITVPHVVRERLHLSCLNSLNRSVKLLYAVQKPIAAELYSRTEPHVLRVRALLQAKDAAAHRAIRFRYLRAN